MNIKVYENAINNNKILLFKNQKYNKFCIYEEEILKKAEKEEVLTIPFDVILMTQVMNECLCFDRTMKLMTLLDEAIYTVADIKSLKTFGNQTHSFIIKDNYVYDTSKTYKIRKNYFYKTEKPVIKLQLTGEQIKNVLKTQGDFINEKNQIIIILDNVKRRNIDLYNTLKEYFIINEIKILSTKEEMKAFLYRIIHHFKDESLYSKKLSDRIKKLT